MKLQLASALTLIVSTLLVLPTAPSLADEAAVRTGKRPSATGPPMRPGFGEKLPSADLPPPFATLGLQFPAVVPQPADAKLKVPPGFKVERSPTGLVKPRLLRVAPNGDIFVAESSANQIRGDARGRRRRSADAQRGFRVRSGPAVRHRILAAGPNPKFVYVGNTGSVVRFPYQNGDLHARGPAETIVPSIPSGGHLTGGGHWTRDVVFSPDGSKMFVSVGSHSNDWNSTALSDRQYRDGGLGNEEHRADVLRVQSRRQRMRDLRQRAPQLRRNGDKS